MPGGGHRTLLAEVVVSWLKYFPIKVTGQAVSVMPAKAGISYILKTLWDACLRRHDGQVILQIQLSFFKQLGFLPLADLIAKRSKVWG